MRTSVDVHNYLLERDVPHEMVPTRGRLRSPDRMAAVLGLPPEQVGRVVLLRGSDNLVAVLVPSHLAADLERAGEASGQSDLVELAPEGATEATDYLHEALPPAGLPPATRVVMDRSLAEQEVLYFPGGEPSSLLKIRPDDLVRATDARVAPVSE
jgi:Cys-tRNA(Pro)/Cys-tRNA(Cys) deacylase